MADGRGASGGWEIRQEPDAPAAWVVSNAGVPQSYVDLGDPDHLRLSYLHAMAALCATVPRPVDIVHVGGAGMSLLRHLAAHRPGSRHVVVEPEAALTALVLERLPLPTGVPVRHLALDGRAGLAALGDDAADLVLVDAFVGDRVPGSLTTTEAVAELRRVLRPDGRFLLNLGDAADHGFLRRLVATVRPTFSSLVVAGRPAPVAGQGYGNLVLGAGRDRWDEQEVRRQLDAQPMALTLLGAGALTSYDGVPLSDAEPLDSPALGDVLARPADPCEGVCGRIDR